MSFFNNLPPKVPGTLRLFDRQDFYSAHGEDAYYVADQIFKTSSVLKFLGKRTPEEGLASCTLTIPTAKGFLRDALTSKQLRVEIWAPKPGESGRRSGAWQLSKQASPGNLQEVEDLLFLGADVVASPIVMALRVKMQDGNLHVGMAFADATNRELGVAEYAENDLFTNTESLLIQLGVKECLIPASDGTDYDLAKLRAVVERCGCVVSESKKGACGREGAWLTSRLVCVQVDRAGPAPPRQERQVGCCPAYVRSGTSAH